MKKLSLWLVVLSMLTALLPGTMVSAEQTWYNIEVEDGTPISEPLLKKTEFDRTYMYTVQGTSSARGTTSTFEIEEAGTYDIWAAVGTHQGNGNNLCTYTFTLNETAYDPISAKTAYTDDVLYTTTQGVAGEAHKMTVVWAKVATNVSLSGEQTLKAEITGATSSAGNKFGVMDAVRIVPSSWNWKPKASFDAPSPTAKEENVPDENGVIHIEAESGEIGGEGITTVSDSAASGGKYIMHGIGQNSGGSTVTFKTESRGTYDIWAAIGGTDKNAYASGATEFVGGYKFTLDEDDEIYDSNISGVDSSNADLYGKTVVLISAVPSESAATVRWVKVAEAKSISAGEHTLDLYTKKTVHGAGLIDCVRLIPTGYTWEAKDFTTAPVPGVPGGDDGDGDGDEGDDNDGIITPDKNGVVHLEAENGTVAGYQTTDEPMASGGKYLSIKKHNNGFTTYPSTTMSFKLNEGGKYDIYAAMATGSQDYLGGQKFTLDGSVIFEANMSTFDRSNADLYGKDIDLHSGTPHMVKVRWVKIAEAKEIGKGTHTIVNELCKYGNANGIIDCVRLIPAGMIWGASDFTTAPVPGTPVGEDGESIPDENGIIDIEAENGELGGSMKIYDLADASKGKYAASKNTQTPGTIAMKFSVPEEATYDIWAAVAIPNTTQTHLGGYSFTLDVDDQLYSKNHNATDKTHPAMYSGITLHTGDATGSASTVNWIKVASKKKISAGLHTLTAATIPGTPANTTGAVDCVRIIPTGIEWAAIELPDTSAAKSVAEDIKKTYFTGDYTAVTENIEIPEDMDIPANATVSFESDKPEVVAANGEVTRPYFNAEDADVTFYVCASVNGKKVKLPVEMTVLKNAKYTVDIKAPSSLTAGGTFRVSAKVKLNAASDSGISGKCTMVVALYNADGSLAAIAMDSSDVTPTVTELGANVNVPSENSGCYAKVYVMNDLEMANAIADTVTVR